VTSRKKIKNDFFFAGKRTEVEQALCEQVSGQVRLPVQNGVRSKEASGSSELINKLICF
jgi:hypothetical protein